jgi:peroxiredoxin
VILVLPQGAFRGTRVSVERKLGAFPHELGGPLLITEDHQGSWTDAFNAPAEPATYLMSGTGEFAWQQTGPLQARALTAALDQHGRAGHRYQSRFLRLAVGTGEPAPDVVFRGRSVQDQPVQDQRADQLLLGRLRGQRVLLLFWKTWSAPCLAELRRLQRMQDQSRTQGPVILAIVDGEEEMRIEEIARELNLRFSVVPDPKSQLATRFGVTCWPTSVSIDERGRVQRAHFGAMPNRSGRTHSDVKSQ